MINWGNVAPKHPIKICLINLLANSNLMSIVICPTATVSSSYRILKRSVETN
jgi:hypothetical protein